MLRGIGVAVRRGFVVARGCDAHQQLEMLIDAGELALESLELGFHTGMGSLDAPATPNQLCTLGDGGAPEASGNL